MSEPAADGFVAIPGASELWDGEMEAFEVGDEEVLVIKLDGAYHAYDGLCPHQAIPLVEGELAGAVLTCSAHEWQFDAATGAGVNPAGICLRRHEARLAEGGALEVRLSGRA